MEHPLAGWRVVITRSEGQRDGLAQRLRALGAEPIFFPTIAFAPPEDTAALDNALLRLRLGLFDWIALTSANAARFMLKRWVDSGLTLVDGKPLLPSLHVATVGPATAAACHELLGLTPTLVPETFVAEALAGALGDLTGQRVLLLNADLARPTLERLLREHGALVERVVAYHTVPADGGVDLVPLLTAGHVTALTFTSGSAARFFVQRIGADAVADARRAIIACIGPVSAEECRALGLPPTVTATTSTEEGLVDALVEYAKSSDA